MRAFEGEGAVMHSVSMVGMTGRSVRTVSGSLPDDRETRRAEAPDLRMWRDILKADARDGPLMFLSSEA